jgi:thymidylate synthase (FAD)
MTLIEPYVELITEENPFKKIEMAGRTCYKSEANITDESALKFYQRLADNQHTAMLEHATFVFKVVDYQTFETLSKCKYLNCTMTTPIEDSLGYRKLVSGNLRAINESGNYELLTTLWYYDKRLVYNVEFLHFIANGVIDIEAYKNACTIINLSDYNDLTTEEIEVHTYTTMRFTCDRGVSHELVRHRPFSFAQESTRYVNYSKEQNGNGDIKFIKPADYDNWNSTVQAAFDTALVQAELNYNTMIHHGAVAQEARAILPNAVKTEIIVTGNEVEWKHFFNLRHFGTTGKPHPDMQVVADMAYEIYQKV